MLPLPYKLLAGLVAGMAIFAAGGYSMHEWDSGQFAKERAKTVVEALQQQQAAFKQYQADILKASIAEASAQATVDALRAQIVSVKGHYAKLPKSPVPVDCRLSDDRLRVIQSAVAAAASKNPTASQPLDPVPGLNPTH